MGYLTSSEFSSVTSITELAVSHTFPALIKGAYTVAFSTFYIIVHIIITNTVDADFDASSKMLFVITAQNKLYSLSEQLILMSEFTLPGSSPLHSMLLLPPLQKDPSFSSFMAISRLNPATRNDMNVLMAPFEVHLLKLAGGGSTPMVAQCLSLSLPMHSSVAAGYIHSMSTSSATLIPHSMNRPRMLRRREGGGLEERGVTFLILSSPCSNIIAIITVAHQNAGKKILLYFCAKKAYKCNQLLPSII